MSEANHDLSFLLDEPGPAEWRGDFIEANIFSRVGPRATVAQSTDGGRARTAVRSGVDPVLCDVSYVRNALFWPNVPLGAYTPIVGREMALARYMGISGTIACGRSGGFRFFGYGITVRVTAPPQCLQHKGGFSFGLGRHTRRSRCSRRISRLQLPWRKP